MSRLFKPLLLVTAIVNLLVGMFSGLGRLGWVVPLPEAYAHHGAIMVGGFLGTLIALEKVIPLKQPLFYLGPLLSAISVVVFLVGDFHVAVAMQAIAGLLFVAVYGAYLRKQRNLPLWLAGAGALCWVVASALLWWKQFYPMVFPWYIAFLLFTIVSERLELARFLPVTPKDRRYLLTFLGLYLLGLIIPFHGWGKYASGLALVGVSVWLLRFDVIRITLHKEGLVRFTAVALLCGYVTLMLEGFFLLFLGDMPYAYDMLLHNFFLGFVFCMIFAHGPIILPGVLGLSVKPYSTVLYVPLLILLASLLVRLLADAMLLPVDYRAVSGWFSMGGILLYFLSLAVTTIIALKRAPLTPG
ncbi:MAG: hypothetical protein JNN04_02970 [Cyclobacteriaceae bacterium]|nr:hypothetical protein [Cyclobacteriaceae bacterium]